MQPCVLRGVPKASFSRDNVRRPIPDHMPLMSLKQNARFLPTNALVTLW